MTPRIIKQFCLIILSLFVSVLSYAQGSFVPVKTDSLSKNLRVLKPVVKKPKPISKEFSVGARLNTDGWSIYADKGWVKSDDSKNSDKFYNTRIVQVEFTEHKHAKEIKTSNTGPNFGEKPKPYKYGKINNFYALKFGYGYRRMLAGKPDPGTVSIHWVYAGGLSVGFLKPYYIDAYVENNVLKSIKYEDDPEYFIPDFRNQPRIVGRSSLFEGIGQTKIIPGIHLKTALQFDFAASPKTKLAIETGINVEVYTQKIPIMAAVKSYPYLLNGYLALQFGKRK